MLGSPFMERLLALAAERLAPGTAVAERVLGWRGDVTSRGQSVPLRLAGALHAVKRAGHAGLTAVYPPAETSDAALWAAVEAAFSDRSEALMAWTNEVRRSAAILPALHLVAARFGLPLRLSELGCSAGLNLRADHYRLDAGGVAYGDPSAAVRLAPDWTGPAPRRRACTSRAGPGWI